VEFQQIEWLQILDVWKGTQESLRGVHRWTKYYEGDGGARAQDSLQHSFSITFLAAVLLDKLRTYVDLDAELLMTAVLVHDCGEAEMGNATDTHYIDKTQSGDVAELHAFLERFTRLPDVLFTKWFQAFLLQFALKPNGEFPESARKIMVWLADNRKMEALAFEAVERWDYVLYALEQYVERGNVKILVQTLRHQSPHLDRLARELPGFGREVWTDEVRKWCQAFLREHRGEWIEKKGEA